MWCESFCVRFFRAIICCHMLVLLSEFRIWTARWGGFNILLLFLPVYVMWPLELNERSINSDLFAPNSVKLLMDSFHHRNGFPVNLYQKDILAEMVMLAAWLAEPQAMLASMLIGEHNTDSKLLSLSERDSWCQIHCKKAFSPVWFHFLLRGH